MIKSPYKMGWIMVMFDLPVTEEEQRKAAAQFRKQLLEDGYCMLNFSVYIRPCPSWTRMAKHIERLRYCVPVGGNVHIFFLTDKQWKDSVSIIGKDYSERRKIREAPSTDQLSFW